MSACSSASFELLHPRLRRWVALRGWRELRDIQEAAIPLVLDGADAVITAPTAGGKTEAVFLPILTRLAGDAGGSIRALCLSPLKALINDQYGRLELLCREVDVAVNRWHGDVGRGPKRRVFAKPSGVLLITPESLEAIFVLRGPGVGSLFRRLDYMVVDELHSFIGTERGRQLQSLLHRVELAVGRRVPRLALSATLGDMGSACEFLRPGDGEGVRLIRSADRRELKLEVRGYRTKPPEAPEMSPERMVTGDVLDISEHLFKTLRGRHSLIFANARASVEKYADRLRRLCAHHRVPNEFRAHHGSLSKELREDAESSLKSARRPAGVVCTTTLELGIDIGSIECVAQIGTPPSVARLCQRLGRSGRKGQAAEMRIYVRERELTEDLAPQDTLRSRLFETVAMVRLLSERWYEPPLTGALHLSTLVQQLLSLLAQFGGIRADQAWTVLCGRGPFSGVSRTLFVSLLRSLATHDLIAQTHSSELVLGLRGERLVNHYSFYTAFTTPQEYRLLSDGRELGSLPISYPLFKDLYLIFGGRRWRILAVDQGHRVVKMEPARGGRPPFFGGSPFLVHDRVREEMLRLYASREIPAFLDRTGQELLGEGRESFRRYRLGDRALLRWGQSTLVFCWKGDRVLNTLSVWLRSRGLRADREGIALAIESGTPHLSPSGGTPAEVGRLLKELAESGPPDGRALAGGIENKSTEKYHRYLGDDLLSADYAACALDPEGAWQTVVSLCSRRP
ncbi:MAG: DEAD/DEAH box helicase [bacterium]|nr:DEAD/DEAH box helicase [bacterium]